MPRIVLDLSETREELGQETADLLLELGNAIVNELKRNSPVGATGDLRRSWQIFSQGGDRIVLGSDIGYARYVDEGTPPHTPPFAPIEKWSRRVLGSEDAAWAVWNKIREEGTEAQPYIDESIQTALDDVV